MIEAISVRSAIRRASWGLAGGALLGGAVFVATSYAQDSPPDPVVTHVSDDPGEERPPSVLVEASNVLAKIEHIADIDAPCAGGPCLGGDVLAVAQATLDRCAKVGNEEFSQQNPERGAADPLIALDRALRAACEGLRQAIQGDAGDADRAQAAALGRVPELRNALARADASVGP